MGGLADYPKLAGKVKMYEGGVLRLALQTVCVQGINRLDFSGMFLNTFMKELSIMQRFGRGFRFGVVGILAAMLLGAGFAQQLSLIHI